MCKQKFEYGNKVKVWNKDKKYAVDGIFLYDLKCAFIKCRYIVDIDGHAYGFKHCEIPKQSHPNYEIDHKVWVKELETNHYISRYFAGWDKNGKIKCFLDGGNSHTKTKDEVHVWEYYTDVDPYK